MAVVTHRHRQSKLAEARRLKMARSAHAYVRGSTLEFYKWLDSSNGKSMPQGPPIWICGDCHVGNLGPVADAKGRVQIAIRDLDQTVIGNPAQDLIRLGLSLATAIRESDLPGVTTALMLEQMMEGYVGALVHRGKTNIAAPRSVQRILRKALHRRIEDVRPAIPLGKRFWPLSAAEKKEIRQMFEAPEVRRLVTGLQGRNEGDDVEVFESAYWIKEIQTTKQIRWIAAV